MKRSAFPFLSLRLYKYKELKRTIKTNKQTTTTKKKKERRGNRESFPLELEQRRGGEGERRRYTYATTPETEGWNTLL